MDPFPDAPRYEGHNTGAQVALRELVPCDPDIEIAAARIALAKRHFLTLAHLIASPQWEYAKQNCNQSQGEQLSALERILDELSMLMTQEDADLETRPEDRRVDGSNTPEAVRRWGHSAMLAKMFSLSVARWFDSRRLPF